MKGSLLCLVVGVALGSATVPVASPDQAKFRTGTDAVLVDVQVTSRGRPVAGLTAADFDVRDSGVAQEIQVAAFDDVPISLLLALDVSYSMEGEPLEHLKRAAAAAIGALRRGDQAALLTFSERIALQADWTTDRQALASAVNALEPRGWTSLHDAVLTSIALRESAAGRVVLLIFTDGSDTSSWLDPQAVVRATERSDLVITAVSAATRPTFGSAREARLALALPAALRRWFDADPALFPYVLLERLAEETGGDVLYTSANRDLSSTFQKIVSNFGTRYLITYAPKGVPASGWHPLSVSVKGRSVDVKARRGYWR